MSASTALGSLLWSESVCPDHNTDIPADYYDARVESDWDEFLSHLPSDFEPENEWCGMSQTPGWDAWDQLAHDWILTRNRHGAGFWDGDWVEPVASHLTNLAHQSGQLNVILCDRQIHPYG